MIMLGHGMCLPSQATVQNIFLAARDANAIPDISLDPGLATFLSLDSAAALQHQYASLQRGLSETQRATFGVRLQRELGGPRVRGNSSAQAGQSPVMNPSRKLFGIAVSSRIGGIAQNYLRLIPGLANDPDTMAETTEIYDNWLKLELLDHYHRMTNKKRMSSVSMQQWLTGAALHLHMRIHQVRLHSVPFGSAASLRLSYKTAFNRLVQGYTVYLHRNLRETAPSAPAHRTSQSSSPTNRTLSGQMSSNTDRADTFNETTHGNVSGTDESAWQEGLLFIEPGRNVTHGVRHHPCESPAIQQALVTRIINAQDLEDSRGFFLFPKKVFQRLLTQDNTFELDTNYTGRDRL
ncbi:uncharacterized protein LOC130906734 isoform X2 [Corythoichthys intestinalis]|uniref:uncharacterized protein LOC130906734 isoform X2 n=1 Tax=Corythoichthys intestinalis TaxID=161448 RepID=UPI0025A60684|nr:uncharacterized protein LOC130906734 isoform X2 [Corythoichthys intestinalis]